MRKDDGGQFDVNQTSGELVYKNSLKDGLTGVDGLDGAFGVVISNDGRHAYTTGFWDSAVSWFERNASTGSIVYKDSITDGENGVDGLSKARSLLLSKDGKFVYVAGNWDNSISWFERTRVQALFHLVVILKMEKMESMV